MNIENIKTILMPAPHYYLFNPAGIPYLTGYLAERGFQVIQKILDRESFAYFLSKEQLEKSFAQIKDSIIPRMEQDDNLNRQILADLRIFAEKNLLFSMMGMESINDNILILLCEMKDQIILNVVKSFEKLEELYTTMGTEEYGKCTLWMSLGLKIATLPFFPSNIDYANGYTFGIENLKIKSILDLTEDYDHNPLLNFYEDEIYPWLKEENPDIIGLQINLENQLIPGLTLMKWIKQNMPNTFLIVGGTLISTIREKAVDYIELWDYFDALCVGMGEYTMEELIKTLATDGNLDRVPNLVYKKKDKKGTVEFIATEFKQVKMNDLGFPKFDDSRPKPIIPMFTAAGCYYMRCAFCYFPYHHQNCKKNGEKVGYFTRDIDLVYKDLVRVKEEYDPLFVYLCDSDIAPRRLEKLCDKIIDGKLEIRLFVMIRAEKRFLKMEICEKMAKAGVLSVYMGLEAGNQRINDLMDKGVQLGDIEVILRNFHKVGIMSNLFVMVGTPTETREEAMDTVKFIKRNREFIQGDIAISAFQLPVKSLITLNPEKYGITRVHKGEKDEIKLVYDYEIDKGLQPEQSFQLRDEFRAIFGQEYINGSFVFKCMDSL